MRRLPIVMVILALALGAGSGVRAASAGEARGPVAIGAFLHNSYKYPRLYDVYARRVGRRPPILGAYREWTLPLVDRSQLSEIWRRGAVPLVTWEPWGLHGRYFPLRAIARGRYDPYIRRSARAVARWGKPIFLRFAQEMNGTWFPWGRGRHRNTPRAYVAAWRHIVSVFRRLGVNNVEWTWVPTQNASGRFPFRQYFPGNRWVDWVGLDGFNWRLSPGWKTFDEVFGSSYNSLVQMTHKPVLFAETGSWEHGGSKAVWLRNALMRELPRYGHVRALLWWSVDDSRGDLRVNSSPSALRVLRGALRTPLYEATRADLLATPRRLAGSGAVTLPTRVSPGERVRRALEDGYVWLGIGLLVALALVLAIFTARRRHRREPSVGHRASL